MNISRLLPILSLGCLLGSSLYTNAQDRPIGYWRSMLPYNTAIAVASDGITAFVATDESFYTRNAATQELTTYSKVEGMADVRMSYVGYDKTTGTAVLAYLNSNIDLFKDNDFTNIPDLKKKSVTGSKKINHIYCDKGYAYLSTDIGVVVINLDKKEIKETYNFTRNNVNIPVTGFTTTSTDYYASTTSGLYRIGRNDPKVLDFNAWTTVDNSRDLLSVVSINDTVFTTTTDTVFAIENSALLPVYNADSTIRHLDVGKYGVWIIENYPTYRGGVRKLSTGYELVDSFQTGGWCNNLVELPDGKIWLADRFSGLKERAGNNPNEYNTILPEGPSDYTSFDIYAYNKELWVAHGGYNDKWAAQYKMTGFSNFLNEDWKSYRQYEYPPFGDSVYDISTVIKGPDGNVYAGAYQSGLFIMKGDGSYEYYKQNSILDVSVTASTQYLVSGLAFDNQGNLWINMFGGDHELVVKTKEGNWYEYVVPFGRPLPHAAANLIIDDYNQKWYIAPLGGGAIVYDDNGTLDNTIDDGYAQLLAGKGSGGLPDNETYCLAKDKDGAIWIGTANGIGIVNCPGQVIQRTCEAEMRVVQYDDFAGYMFQEQQVRAIAVDGGNRKWIGTNNGVWLISPQGDKIISRFTAENSPLPSNRIQKITIDPITGDVYFGTELGLISYRGTATEGGTENKDVLTYPNPVPSGYNGTIAIRGLVENADVRITDIAGQLVYRTIAYGGQAIWNGVDYKGHRPQSGVYLIFISNKDGSQTHVGKMVFME